MKELRYNLQDQNGVVLAKGDQLKLVITVDLENREMRVESGANNTVCDIAGNDTFTLSFKNAQNNNLPTS